MISTIVLVVAAGLLALHLASAGLAAWHMSRRADARFITGTPRIGLLRPVTGSDPLDAETLGSSFDQDWPDYEVVFCAPSAEDPVVPLIGRLMAENPGVPARLLTGQEWITGNPKLDNLWKGWEATRALQWICMADSNLLLPRDYLTTLVRSWDKRAGMVSSPACGQRPEGLAASVECAFLNTGQGRLQLAAAALGQGLAQGKTLFWNRDLLESEGGLRVLGRWLAEDVAANRLMRATGRKIRVPPRLFAQPIGRRSFRAVWDRQLRWSRVRRDGFPGAFLAEVLNGAFVPALLVLAAAGVWPMIALLILWYGVEWALARRAGWPHGAPDLLAMVLRDLMMPAVWVATFFSRQIVWRGTGMSPVAAAGAPTAAIGMEEALLAPTPAPSADATARPDAGE